MNCVSIREAHEHKKITSLLRGIFLLHLGPNPRHEVVVMVWRVHVRGQGGCKCRLEESANAGTSAAGKI